ncbi:MAG TPA: nicotinate phosphoribosyltransferase [Burkholderiales bacterium]|nr:nicotinate phosphoribosyltransferase [Burkholderiales bacterium]
MTADRHALFTDLYELTMLQAYLEEGMEKEAVFSLFVRRLPQRRNYLLACGLETVLDYLENLRFDDGDIAYLRSLGKFSDRFLAWLADFRFTGEVHAVPEGTVVYANEPILEVIAPLPQAQLVETFIMNQVHYQTMAASKASRVITAARGRRVVDFGARRFHGTDAAIKAARAFYIAGVAATSNVEAGRRYGIPVAGTMAHSYIQAHEGEVAAFRAFARLYPDTVLLVDTYDTLAAVRKVIDLARESGDAFEVTGLRIDSGDLVALSREARRLLDEAGLQHVELVASGNLDEDRVAALLEADAPFDTFGVGTAMGVSNDAPSLDIAYKLTEYGKRGRVKLSADKPVFPGRHQIYRMESDGYDVHDVIGRAQETLAGRPLLGPVMKGGKRLSDATPPLDRVREHAREQVMRLPEHVRRLSPAEPPYPVQLSDALTRYQHRVSRNFLP